VGGEPGTDLHVHHEHADAFLVLEGEMTFRAGPAAEALRLGAGGFLAAPPHLVHSYANEGAAKASWLNFHAPDTGFGAYLRSLFEGPRRPFDQRDPPEDGGRPLADATVVRPGEATVRAALPGVTVAEWPDLATAQQERDAAYVVDARGRALTVTFT
jgi:hypothetical protein